MVKCLPSLPDNDELFNLGTERLLSFKFFCLILTRRQTRNILDTFLSATDLITSQFHE